MSPIFLICLWLSDKCTTNKLNKKCFVHIFAYSHHNRRNVWSNWRVRIRRNSVLICKQVAHHRCCRVACVEAGAPACTGTIHRQNIGVREIPNALKTVLVDAVKTVHFIRSRQWIQGISVRCGTKSLTSSCTKILLHTEARWLSTTQFWFVYSHCASDVVLGGAVGAAAPGGRAQGVVKWKAKYKIFCMKFYCKRHKH
jgi:hypothetical protein